MAITLTPATTGAALTSAGVGSSLDVNGIVSKLMTVAQQPLTLLQQQASSYQSSISAYGSLQSALSQFQSSMSSLANASQYQSTSATSSNPSVATVSATSAAIQGSYSLAVSQLAQSQQLLTSGVASASTAIGSGATTTLSFNFGTISGGTLSGGIYSNATFTSNGSGTQTVTINSSDNSLTGIANAINSANIGVTASIVNDGSATNPYHLLLTSTATGQSNSMQISVSGDATLSSLLSENPASNTGQSLTQTVAAQNANFTVDGVPITSASNTDSTAISGLSLNLLSTGSSTVSVSTSTTGITNAVNQFVSAYNTVIQTLQSDTGYSTSTKQAGPLNGDPTVTGLLNQITGMLSQPVAGGPSAMDMLFQAGITLQGNGTLAVNSTQLQSAINANPTAFAGMFAQSGQATDSQINYSGSTSATQPGTYAVNITQLATQSNVAGTAALSSSTTITAGSNDTLQVQLDGNTENIVLPPGTYTPAQLASAVQSAINGNTTFAAAGSSVTAGINASGALQLTSSRYGSASYINIIGGDGQSTLNFAGAIVNHGVDVAGSINGVTATGSGQTLTGATGNASAGLSINVVGGATGSRGTISYSTGYAYQFNQFMTNTLGSTGIIQQATNNLNTLVQQNNQAQAAEQAQLNTLQAQYMAQFNALDTFMSSMTNTSNYLTQQLTRTST